MKTIENINVIRDYSAVIVLKKVIKVSLFWTTGWRYQTYQYTFKKYKFKVLKVSKNCIKS